MVEDLRSGRDAPAPPPYGVHLTRTDENADEINALAALLAEHGGGRTGMPGLLADLDRKARRSLVPPRLLGGAVTRALTWEPHDRRDPGWWPQGISTSVHTDVDRDVIVTSWYSKKAEEGSRVSFLDLGTRRYRHVLLVEPTLKDGTPGFTPLRAHAGGIVWHGPYLHVAATGRGFYTCRTDDVLRVPAEAGMTTYGHEHVLPVRFAYRASSDEGVERLRFSFMTLDRTSTPPALVVGEYGNDRQTRRIARFAVDEATGLLAVGEDGTSRPVLEGEDGVARMQGIAVTDGSWYATSSHGPWGFGHVHVGRPGEFRTRKRATPPGPEDLVYWPSTDLLWCVSEHPRRRWVFGMSRSRLGG